MSWRLELSDLTCLSIQILEGAPPLVAIWTSSQEVLFYSVENGAFYGQLSVVRPVTTHSDGLPNDAAWRSFLETLRGPNHVYLSPVRTEYEQLLCSYDGRFRVYDDDAAALILEVDHHRTLLPLESKTPKIAIGLDRELGTLGVLTADHRVHVYQQHVYMQTFPLELSSRVPPLFHVLDAGTGLVVADDTRIQSLDMMGRTLYSQATASLISAAACSPGGNWIVLAETNSGIVRIYDEQLTPTYQDSAADLLSQATPVQLWASSLPADTAPHNLDITDDGTLVFVLDNTICRVYIEELTPLPRPRRLF